MRSMENPGADDPCGQVDLTPEAKIGLPPLPKIKMTPEDIPSTGVYMYLWFPFWPTGDKTKET